MKRSKFLKILGFGAAGAVVAPKVIAEAVSKHKPIVQKPILVKEVIGCTNEGAYKEKYYHLP